jgi:mono/diheme cytochrome c family protein
MKRNLFALVVVLLVIIGLPAGLFGYQAWQRGGLASATGVRVVDMVARSPELGGFAPDHVELRAGEPVRLRLSSPDVVHGLTIPGLDVNVDEIVPGKVVEVNFTPEKPGRYAFACTRWCSVDHWRMRGVIQVLPGAESQAGGSSTPNGQPGAPVTQTVPLYQRLGLNLDAPWPADGPVPAQTPSAARAAAEHITVPENLNNAAQRVRQAPAEAFKELRANPANAGASDDQLWDEVALAWLHDVKPETLVEAKSLYSRDCAACHGTEGKGDGPAGRKLAGMQKVDPALPNGPADLTDARRMLNTSDAALQGKILRGGMGTGMPEFGSLYTDDQIAKLVSYIRTLLFEPPDK